MLNVVRVEFSKLRRWKLLRVLPLLSLVLPAITFSYFATHPDYLTDMGLYKQALFSFNIFLILPAILVFMRLGNCITWSTTQRSKSH